MATIADKMKVYLSCKFELLAGCPVNAAILLLLSVDVADALPTPPNAIIINPPNPMELVCPPTTMAPSEAHKDIGVPETVIPGPTSYQRLRTNDEVTEGIGRVDRFTEGGRWRRPRCCGHSVGL